MPHKTLLTGSRHVVALIEARKLHQTGVEVHTADSVDFEYTAYSHAVKKHHVVPSVRFNEEGYIHALCTIIRKQGIHELIPLGEESFYIAKHMQRIRDAHPKLVIHTQELATLTSLHNKWQFYTLAKKLRLPVPDTALVTSDTEVEVWRAGNMQHAIIKPVYSRFGHAVIELPAGTKLKPRRVDWQQKHIIQTYITGTPFSSFSAQKNGEVVCYENPLSLTVPGAMAAARRIQTPKEVRTIDAAIRAKLGYTEQLGLDFIRTPTGEIFLLEANPRATIGRVLLHQPRIQSRIMMLHHLLSGMIPARSLAHYWYIVLRYPDTVWSWFDLLPAYMSQIRSKGLATYIRFRKRHPNTGFQAYSTYDMEYNGEETPRPLVEVPTKKDDADLRALLASLSTPGFLQLIQTHDPSPVESFRRQNTQLAVLKDGRGQSTYMAACTHNAFYIAGKSTNLGYLSAVRKNPAYLGRDDWRSLFYDHFGASTYFFSILAVNTPAYRAFHAPSTLRPAPQLVDSYELMIMNSHRVPKPVSPACQFVSADSVSQKAIIQFLRKQGSRYQFFPVVTKTLLRRIGVTHKNSYVLLKNDVIVGFAGLVDRTKDTQFRITQYPWLISALRPAWNAFARRFGYISIPKKNMPVNCPIATLCVVADDNPALYQELIYNVSVVARKQSDIFMLAVPTTSPHYTFLHTKYTFGIKNNLFIHNNGGHLTPTDQPLYCDALMLY